jgi:hypothetical protein
VSRKWRIKNRRKYSFSNSNSRRWNKKHIQYKGYKSR